MDDLDVEFMTRSQLKDEVVALRQKEQEAKELIQSWANKEGHDRCWYYPDIFESLADHFQVENNNHALLPTLEEFECGCDKYQCSEFAIQKDSMAWAAAIAMAVLFLIFDLASFFWPLGATFMLYIIVARPMWFRHWINKLYRW